MPVQIHRFGSKKEGDPRIRGAKGEEGEEGGGGPSDNAHGVVFVQVTGRPVVVKLNTGVDYKGVLACLDGYMNIAMEQVGPNHTAPRPASPPPPSSNFSPPHPLCPGGKCRHLLGSAALPRVQVAHACMQSNK